MQSSPKAEQNFAVPLTIPETTGVDRQDEAVVGGVPIARGALQKAGWFELQGEAGKRFSVEGSPAAYWPDGSIKWLHLSGKVDLNGGKANQFRLVPAAIPADNNGLSVEQNDNAVSIRNGDYQVRLSPSATNALEVKYGAEGKSLLTGPGISAAMVLNGPDGENRREYSLQFKNEISVVVQTDNRVVVRLPGIFGEVDNPVGEIILFVEILSGAPQIRLQPVFIYLGHPDRDLVSSLTLTAHTPNGEGAHYGFANEQGKGYWDVLQPYEGGPEWTQARQVQLGSSFYQTEKRVSAQSPWVKISEGKHSQGWAHLGDESGGVTAAMRYFWQEYPRSLIVDTQQSTLTFGLVPPNTSPLDLRRYSSTIYGAPVYEYGTGEFPTETHGAGGIAKASELLLHFHPQARQFDGDEPARQALAFNHPARLMTDPEYFASTQVVGQIAPKRAGAFQEAETDMARIADFLVKEREIRGWYGLMNYGDVMIAFYSDRGRWAYDDGGYAWMNTESLPDLGLWLAALRCGRTDWLEAAMDMTRHNRDVDTYHRGEFQGFGTRHNVNHWGDKDKEWRITMPLVRRLHYYMTGDPWTLEVIKATVARYQTFARTAVTAPSTTSALAGIMVKCELDNRPQDWQVLKRLTGAFTRAVREDGQFTSQLQYDLSTGEAEPVGDRTMTNSSFFMNTFGGQHTLVEIADLLDDKPLKDAIVRHVNFFVEATESPEKLADLDEELKRIADERQARRAAADPDQPPPPPRRAPGQRNYYFELQPFLALAYRHTQDQRFRQAAESQLVQASRLNWEIVGGDGLLDEPLHERLAGQNRKNKITCHLGNLLHLTPYSMAVLQKQRNE